MARKHCTTRVRSRQGVILNKDTQMVALYAYTQECQDWTKWQHRTVSLRKAEEMLRAGQVERVARMKDGLVQVVGFRATLPNIVQRPSPATLTRSTMEAFANRNDPRLSPRDRAQVEKVLVWPLIGDTKAVAVRPRLSENERRLGEALLNQKAA